MRGPDPARPHDLARTDPLRVRPDHEGLLDLHARTVARRQQLSRFVGAQADRLLAENVLASLGRPDRPRDVELVRQRVVDRVDFPVVHELLI